MQDQVPLSLSNLCYGGLEEQFQEQVPIIMSRVKPGQKASLGITITFERMKDTSTLVATEFKLTPKYPSISKTAICQVTGDNNLKTDPVMPEKSNVVNLFEAK